MDVFLFYFFSMNILKIQTGEFDPLHSRMVKLDLKQKGVTC